MYESCRTSEVSAQNKKCSKEEEENDLLSKIAKISEFSIQKKEK